MCIFLSGTFFSTHFDTIYSLNAYEQVHAYCTETTKLNKNIYKKNSGCLSFDLAAVGFSDLESKQNWCISLLIFCFVL